MRRDYRRYIARAVPCGASGITLGDDEAVIVDWSQAMIILSQYARSTRLGRDFDHDALDWRNGTVLLMDALEIRLLWPF